MENPYQRSYRSNAVIIQTIKTRRPGYIVFEDSFQIAAGPFDEVRHLSTAFLDEGKVLS